MHDRYVAMRIAGAFAGFELLEVNVDIIFSRLPPPDRISLQAIRVFYSNDGGSSEASLNL